MSDISNKDLFETMPVPKAIAKLAVPTVISQLIALVYNLVDAFFIGRTGNSYMIAGSALAYTIFMMTIAFSNMFGLGGGSLIARLSGIHEYDEARKVSSFSFYGAIISAVLYSLLIGLFMEPILILFGASPLTLGFAKQYTFIVVVLGNIPVILSTTIAHLLRNVGYSKESSIGLSIGGILNIIFDPIFMFVILPDGMEVVGASIATLLANIIACIYLIFIMKKAESTSPLSMKPGDMTKIRKRDMKELFYVGIPAAILTTLFDAANIVLNAITATYGDFMVAALGIAMRAERVAYSFNLGICQGMMPLLAYNYGSGNLRRMNDTIRIGRLIGLSCCVASAVLIFVCASPIARFFMSTSAGNAEEALITIGAAIIITRIRTVGLPSMFLNYHTSVCLQAMGNGKGTLIHAFVRELVFYIPFMFILNALMGSNGLALSLFAGETCGAIYGFIVLGSFLRKNDLKLPSGGDINV
ncbi:MAG: MATE family efflux transporter [Firmicutes bacterium]|nr:MATE family efflux transporter [Bacillota bacterium]